MTVENWARAHEPSGDGAAPGAGAAREAAAGEAGAGEAGAGEAAAGEAGGDDARDAAVAAVREFNRFYTNVIGLLRGKYLDTPYSLTESRLLFELGQREASEVTDLRRVVDIDPGYLSRILARFESDGLVARER
ncbi:MAG TPA: helix-turn-helix domain-containing protein, partial [Streptosporangiaceae bacterium]|nr:helix-turn-helix domain-containing protein [Streptosporangiaceae bacterium]